MAIDTKRREYTTYSPQWRMMRDCIAGDDHIKAGGTLYVPKLDDQSDTDYKAMLNRAVFENFTSRTLDGVTGLIFAKAPLVEAGAKLTQLFDNIDLDESTLTDLAQSVVSEVVTVGRCGILVDMPNINTDGMTQAQVEAMNIRPYAKVYPTESIINWKTDTVNNVPKLTMLVLFETYDKWLNQFESEEAVRYRAYTIEGGVCVVTIYEKNGDGKFEATDMPQPIIMNGRNIDFIPFVSITPENITITPAKSPLYDLAKVNINYFQTAVDYAHGAHFTALPTAYIAGHQIPDGQAIKLGSTAFHVFNNPQAKMEFLEFQGDGLQTLERKMTYSKQSMSVLGARMLQSESAQIAENTLAMKTSGERAVITSLADTVSRGIKKVLEYMAMWMGDNAPITFELNTDYNLTTMTSKEVNDLVTAWLSGGITEYDLFLNLQKGEIIDESATYEEWQAMKQEEQPKMTVTPNVAN